MALLLCCFGGAYAAEGVPRPKLLFVDEPAPPVTVGELGELATDGITLDLLQTVFGRLGLDVELRLMPWNRALKTAEEGQADGLPLLMKAPERESYLAYTDWILEGRELFYYDSERMASFEWDDFADLKGARIGLITGYTYGEDFLKAIDEIGLTIIRSNSNEDSLRLLMGGRLDLTLQDEILVNDILKRRPDWGKRVKNSAKAVSTYYWYMGISRKSPALRLLPDINREIHKLRKEGTLDVILRTRTPEGQ